MLAFLKQRNLFYARTARKRKVNPDNVQNISIFIPERDLTVCWEFGAVSSSINP